MYDIVTMSKAQAKAVPSLGFMLKQALHLQ